MADREGTQSEDEIQRLWRQYGGSKVAEAPRLTFRVKPHNPPYKRVLTAAGLVQRFPQSGLLSGLAAVLRLEREQPLAGRLETALGLGAQKDGTLG